jgi:hypothetical protein
MHRTSLTHTIARVSGALLAAVALVLSVACGADNGAPDSGAAFGSRLPGVGASAATSATPAPVATQRAEGSAPPAMSRADGAQAGDIDPCTLISGEEAKAALGGRQPKAAKHTDFLGDPQCLYEEPEDGDIVSIVVDATNRGREARESHDFVRRTLGYEQVRGVGDVAFIQPGLNLIDVVAGGTRFKIQIASYALPETETRARLIELGKGAVNRLR